ncbi:MAG: hypothetical protein ACI35V_03165 [Sphingobacterium composti]|uniref:hypothetical protein n=1 Tax=Sphingobacterium composti TaxID=363260 RepID=UPI001357E96D|nr:hypothetical protein [Sphingobacterium composti Ten et al. 2007 non Yoo et al. 2007]
MKLKFFGLLAIFFLFSISCDKDDYSSADIKNEIDKGISDNSILGEWETVSSYYIAKEGNEILIEETEEYVDAKDKTSFLFKSGNVGRIKEWDGDSEQWQEYLFNYTVKNRIIEFSFEFQDEGPLIAIFMENFPFEYTIQDDVLKSGSEFTDEDGINQKQTLVLNNKADS